MRESAGRMQRQQRYVSLPSSGRFALYRDDLQTVCRRSRHFLLRSLHATGHYLLPTDANVRSEKEALWFAESAARSAVTASL